MDITSLDNGAGVRTRLPRSSGFADATMPTFSQWERSRPIPVIVKLRPHMACRAWERNEPAPRVKHLDLRLHARAGTRLRF